MRPSTEMLTSIRYIVGLYEKVILSVREKHGLTRTEIDVLIFLHSMPRLNTASKIVELRMLPKANVSQAVELLKGKGLIDPRRDPLDRRVVHLYLTEKAEEITTDLRRAQTAFYKRLTEDLSVEELELYEALNRRIAESAEKYK